MTHQLLLAPPLILVNKLRVKLEKIDLAWSLMKRLCFWIICLGLLLLLPTRPVNADELATNSATKVSAAVKDHTPPSAPILIAPADNSSLTTSFPDFSWYASSDDIGVAYYQLYIDGVIFIANIPTTASETSTYKLVIDSGDGSLKITPKISLTDGTHTWKIVVFDAAGNSNTSAVWDFTIDTLAPIFIVTQISNVTTYISAQDEATWPLTVISVTDNPIQVVATTEANSQVVATLSWGGTIQQTITSSSSSAGIWEGTFGVVPRDTEITLNFLVTDSFGLTSILENIKLIVPSFIPPLIGGGITPQPLATLAPGQPTPPITEPTPLIPPKTIVTGLLTWSWPGGETATRTSLPWIQELILTLSLSLPDSLAKPIRQIVTTPPIEQPFWWGLAVVGAYLIILALAWIWWWRKWGEAWRKSGLRTWWQILGWQRPKKMGLLLGFKVDQSGNSVGKPQPIQMAKIIVTAKTNSDPSPVVVETIFSDQTGQFALPEWPSPKLLVGSVQYSLTVFIQREKTNQSLEFIQPQITWPRPLNAFSYWHHQYYGSWLSLNRNLEFPTLVVCAKLAPDDIDYQNLTQPATKLGIWLTRWAQIDSAYLPILLILSGLISSVWGGWLNWLGTIHLISIAINRQHIKKAVASWTLSLPQKYPDNDWFVITAKIQPADSWWVRSTHDSSSGLSHLKIKLPNQIQDIRVYPIPDQKKANHLPEAWEVNLATQAAQPKLTERLECELE